MAAIRRRRRVDGLHHPLCRHLHVQQNSLNLLTRPPHTHTHAHLWLLPPLYPRSLCLHRYNLNLHRIRVACAASIHERPEGVGTAASGEGKRKGEQYEVGNLASMKAEGDVENSRRVLFPPKQAEKKSYRKSNWFARCLGWCFGGGGGGGGYKQVK